MRTCKEVTELLSNSLESDLPLLTRVGLRLHVLICPPCNRYLSQLKTIRGICRSMDGAEDSGTRLTDDCAARLQDAIDAELSQDRS